MGPTTASSELTSSCKVQPEDELLAASDPFYLPRAAGEVVTAEVSLSP
jgi:hypothetical protein